MDWILILGALSDIAKAVAYKFGAESYNLILAARNHQRLEASVQDLQIRFGIKVKAVEFDALDYGSHSNFYNNLDEKPLGVICAFGYLGNQREAEQNFDEAKNIIDTNFTGCCSILNIISEDFIQRKEGFIIGISSVAGERGRKSNYIYGSAKAAFTAYLSGLRNRVQSSNVFVMTVKPGFVNTKMTSGMPLSPKLTAEPKEVAADIYKAYLKRKDVLYTKPKWRWIMFVVRHIPEKIFKKTSFLK